MGIIAVPRENEDNGYATFFFGGRGGGGGEGGLRVNKVHYGQWENGELSILRYLPVRFGVSQH